MRAQTSWKAALVISDEYVAKLLIDPMRRTILNLLSDKEYTQSQLADLLGLTDASVGHHLSILEEVKLIKIVRREEEVHGIMQKFYRSVALCIVVDSAQMSKSVSKYFYPINVERIRGVAAALQLLDTNETLPVYRSILDEIHESGSLDELAELFAALIAIEAKKIAFKRTHLDRESISKKIYSSALKGLIRSHGKVLIRDNQATKEVPSTRPPIATKGLEHEKSLSSI